MSPWLLVGAVAAALGAGAAGLRWGLHIARTECQAAQAQGQARALEAAAAAASQAAAAVATRTIVHRRIIQEVQRDVAQDPVQRECRSGHESLRLFNDAIPTPDSTASAPHGAGAVPAPDAGDR